VRGARAPTRPRTHGASHVRLTSYMLASTGIAGDMAYGFFCDACFFVYTYFKKMIFVFPAHRVTFALVTYDLLYGV
jgi:hypothetical protein